MGKRERHGGGRPAQPPLREERAIERLERMQLPAPPEGAKERARARYLEWLRERDGRNRPARTRTYIRQAPVLRARRWALVRR